MPTQLQAEALGHPIRREILRAMDGEPISPVQVAKSLQLPISKTSYHFRVLAKTGVLRLVRTQPVRGSTEHFYAVEPLSNWAEELLATAD